MAMIPVLKIVELKHKDKLCECEGCKVEMEECYGWQKDGYDAGLEFINGHALFFVIGDNGRFIVPI